MFDQKKCAEARKQKYLQKCQQLFDTIDIDEFNNYYNTHHDVETRNKFGMTSNQLILYCNTHKITKSKERFKLLSYNSRKEKYGDGNFRHVEKARRTRKDKYGDENYNNKEKISTTYSSKSESEIAAINQKRKETCLVRYGVEASSQSPVVKDKARQTNLERYGVEWFCMTSKCRDFSSNESRANITFKEFLESNNIKHEREYSISQYSYDFKIDNYLIEISPFPYHNVTWNPFNDRRVDKYYHQRKSQTAFDAGFTCIHVFDWTDWEEVIHQIHNRIQIKEFVNPRKYIFNISTMELVDKESDKTVVIFDDGAVYEYR